MNKDLHFKDRKIIRSMDIALIIVLLVISTVLFLKNISAMIYGTKMTAVVYKQNKEIYRVNLSNIYEPFKYIVDGDIKITILFENDGVSVIDSECKDLLCKKHGKISNTADTIVCLPAKVSIKLEGNEKNENIPDAIVR